MQHTDETVKILLQLLDTLSKAEILSKDEQCLALPCTADSYGEELHVLAAILTTITLRKIGDDGNARPTKLVCQAKSLFSRKPSRQRVNGLDKRSSIANQTKIAKVPRSSRIVIGDVAFKDKPASLKI